ncbi:MAG: hypothetical protein HYX68_10550 [Planctomycetes bacterium]|nr:hypothetical protein [Planctomycetota bacterium]
MFGWFKKKTWESPVGAWDNLDIITKRKNGGVDLLIVTARQLDSSPQTIDVLERKFRNYCQYVKSSDFANEFGPPSVERVRIGISSDWEVPDEVMQHLVAINEEEQTPAELALFYQYPTE